MDQQPVLLLLLRQRDYSARQGELASLPSPARPPRARQLLLQHGRNGVRCQCATPPLRVALVPGQEVDPESGGQRTGVGAFGRERGRGGEVGRGSSLVGSRARRGRRTDVRLRGWRLHEPGMSPRGSP